MTSHDNNAHDDAEFDLFLKRESKLAQLLQSLEQPVPSAMLDAAILAKAESELARSSRLSRGASNDPVVPGASHVPPSFLGRWRMPMGLAASVVVGVIAVLLWQGQAGKEMPVQLAQAPQAQEPQMREPQAQAPLIEQAPVAKPAPNARADADRPAAADTAPRAATKQSRAEPSPVPPVVIAQANIPDEEERILRSPAPEPTAPAAASAPAQVAAAAPPAAAAAPPAPAAAPPAAASPPQRTDQAEAGAKHPPKPWLALIEELLKADLRRDAQEEWKQFQKSYPRYPVPEKLKKELDRQENK